MLLSNYSVTYNLSTCRHYLVEPPSEEPSWAKKLKVKMKKLLCFQVKGQNKEHVEAKKAHSRDKAIMRQVGLNVSSGSEDRITDEDAWVRVHCPWTDSDEGCDARVIKQQ